MLLFFFLDRHSGASPEVQKEEEKKFKEVGEAFSVLSDAKKKARYDSGQDLEDDGMNMGGQHLGNPWGGKCQGWNRIKVQIVSELINYLLSNGSYCYVAALKCCADVDSFCLHQILMPTTFSRRSLEAQGVLVLKVIPVLYPCKKYLRNHAFVYFENTSVIDPFVVCFSIWTRKFLLPIWLIGGFFYLNRYNVRTFQQCQPPQLTIHI